MTDERDERRLKDIERQRETGGTVFHGDGTSSQVGSDYGPNHGRATGSDGREYREDFAGNMRRDAGSEPIPVPQFRGPTYPTAGGGTFIPSGPIRGEFALGLMCVGLYLASMVWETLNGWLATHPYLFVGSAVVLSLLVIRKTGGWFRFVFLAVICLYFGVKVWGLMNETPAKPSAPRPAASEVSADLPKVWP